MRQTTALEISDIDLGAKDSMVSDRNVPATMNLNHSSHISQAVLGQDV